MPSYRLISLGLFLYAVYLFTYTPRINSSDGLAMFATAENLVRRGAVDVEQIRWMGLQQGTFGLDGLLYSRKGMGVPIALLPLTWLGFIVPYFGMVTTSLLFNAIVTALTAMLLAHYLARLGYTEFVSILIGLTFGLGTLAWPYAKSLFSDPFSGFLLLITTYALWEYRQTSVRGWLIVGGGALAWNIATRYAEAIFIPIFGLYLLYYVVQKRKPYLSKQSLMALSLFMFPVCLVLLTIASFNISRYGDPFNTGYLPNETFSGAWLQGIIGQLISPGRGLFLYSPIFSLIFIGKWRSDQRAEGGLVISVIVIHILLYGKWFMWHGGYAWGPRFLVPTLPFWCILLAPVAARAFETKSLQSFKILPLGWLYLTLLFISFIPQLLSVMIDFSPFQDTLMAEGLPLFAPATFFEWRYSPFIKAWAFIQPNTLDLAWAWQGHFVWGLAIWLGLNGLLGLVNLYRGQSHINLAIVLAMNLISTGMLLTYAHTLPHDSIKQVADPLNSLSRANEAIIFNNPDLTLPLAELYKGQATVIGLNEGGFPLSPDIETRLQQIIAAHEQVWWLPNWLPPQESAIEQILLKQGVLLRSEQFEGQRLLLWAIPQHLPPQPLPPETEFTGGIHLKQVAYAETIVSGQGFVIQLQWQASQFIEADYHVFVHVVNSSGDTVAQADGQPVHWTRPTSGWQVNEIITDRYGLWLAPNLPSGDYSLHVGWYHPQTGQRLLLPSGTDVLKFKLQLD